MLAGDRTMTVNTEITLPEGIELKQFSPVAYYDKYMDCIRVLTEDRSVTEHRIDGFLTVYENNEMDGLNPRYSGFAIKGIRSLFDSVGLQLTGVYVLTDIIDRIVKNRPGTAFAETLRLIYRDYQATGDHLTVNLAEAA